MPFLTGRVAVFAGAPESTLDSRFGPAPAAPDIYARLNGDFGTKDLAFLIAHPSGNFLNHYLLQSLAELGVPCLALNTRYVGNETNVLMEVCLLDVGVGVRFLREQGYRRVVIIGNSGGGSLAAFYQAEAESRTLDSFADGSPLEFDTTANPSADGIVLLAAHPGRAQVVTEWLDPSVVDERDPFATEWRLDMFDPKNGPPYSADFIAAYRAAQIARNRRITDHALNELDQLHHDGSTNDLPLIVYRTSADPRFIDLSIDANDRVAQSIDVARASNYAPVGMGRMSTLRSWLSQWSLGHSRADGPKCLARTSAPVLIVRYSADNIVYPSQTQAWIDAAGNRAQSETLDGATHFLRGQSDLQKKLAKRVVEWSRATVL